MSMITETIYLNELKGHLTEDTTQANCATEHNDLASDQTADTISDGHQYKVFSSDWHKDVAHSSRASESAGFWCCRSAITAIHQRRALNASCSNLKENKINELSVRANLRRALLIKAIVSTTHCRRVPAVGVEPVQRNPHWRWQDEQRLWVLEQPVPQSLRTPAPVNRVEYKVACLVDHPVTGRSGTWTVTPHPYLHLAASEMWCW